jgi:hypothetical protein
MNIHFGFIIGFLNDTLGLLFCLATAMIGHTRHGSLPWAVFDFLFAPIVWCKWLICKQVNVTLIKKSFGFLLE